MPHIILTHIIISSCIIIAAGILDSAPTVGSLHSNVFRLYGLYGLSVQVCIGVLLGLTKLQRSQNSARVHIFASILSAAAAVCIILILT